MNTASRRNNTCSGSVSNACDQSTDARSVCWRRTAVRAPPVSRRNRSCRLSRISVERQRPDSRRGEFDGQRHAVEPATDLGHRLGVVVGDAEFGLGPAGAVAEQLDRLVGQRQRRHPPGHLAGDADRLATGRQQRQRGARAQQAGDQRRRWRRADARSCRARSASGDRG